MSAWRAAGLNYIQYSNIAARILRQSLKPNLRADALKREDSHVKFTPWKDGKPISHGGDGGEKPVGSFSLFLLASRALSPYKGNLHVSTSPRGCTNCESARPSNKRTEKVAAKE